MILNIKMCKNKSQQVIVRTCLYIYISICVCVCVCARARRMFIVSSIRSSRNYIGSLAFSRHVAVDIRRKQCVTECIYIG
jgi:hypothetical protein